jgi:hypothetical protein
MASAQRGLLCSRFLQLSGVVVIWRHHSEANAAIGIDRQLLAASAEAESNCSRKISAALISSHNSDAIVVSANDGQPCAVDVAAVDCSRNKSAAIISSAVATSTVLPLQLATMVLRA